MWLAVTVGFGVLMSLTLGNGVIGSPWSVVNVCAVGS